MREYKTIGTVNLSTGIIGLDERQAAPRLQVGQVKHLADGVYEIMKPIQIKAGEVIRLEVNKGVAHLMEEINPEPEVAIAPGLLTPDNPQTETTTPPAVEKTGRVARGGRKA